MPAALVCLQARSADECCATARASVTHAFPIAAFIATWIDVLPIGLEIGNRVDRVTLTGDVVLTKDKAGLVLARKPQAIVDGVVKALEA